MPRARTSRTQRTKTGGRTPCISRAKLDRLIAEAIVDCYTESEELTGLYTVIEEHIELPFQTRVLGVDVAVERIDLTEAGEIVAVCRRDRIRQAIPVLALPLPSPPPPGVEWIEAYRRWARSVY